MSDEVSETPCPMCEAGAVGRTWSREVILARRTPQDAAMFFRCNVKTVMDHVNNHEIVIDERGEYTSPDYYMNKLFKLLKTLDDWMTYTIRHNPDKDLINLGLKVVKETRQTLEVLATFQGRLGNQSAMTVQIENMNMKYLQLTQILQEKVCDQCRGRILEAIDVMQSEPQSELLQTQP